MHVHDRACHNKDSNPRLQYSSLVYIIALLVYIYMCTHTISTALAPSTPVPSTCDTVLRVLEPSKACRRPSLSVPGRAQHNANKAE
jgi:hypothetical protein